MIQFRGLIQQFVGSSHQDDDSGYARCDIPPIATLQLENSTTKRDRALIHLLRLNHHTHSVLYSGYKEFPFHNHVPHILGSAYLFGADDKQLHDIYEREDPDIEPWKDSPGEVTGGDWRRYLGDRSYQRAFLDFFEDEMVREGYDWKKVLMDYMLDPESPLLNSLISGFAHPLIHFGYAIELNSREVAMEALALAATSYNYLHKYIELEISPPTAESTTDPIEILRRIREDNRFDGICENPGAHNQTALFGKREDIILKYYNQLDFDKIDLSSMMQSLALTIVLSLTTTHKIDNPQFDFFLCHALTSLYAVRTILPTLPAKYHKTLIRSHWLFTLLTYLTQMRPSIKSELLSGDRVDTSRGWDHINKRALERGLKLEPHYMKALRTMREFAQLYPKDNQFYLIAATKFADEFQDWVGFEYSTETLDIRT